MNIKYISCAFLVSSKKVCVFKTRHIQSDLIRYQCFQEVLSESVISSELLNGRFFNPGCIQFITHFVRRMWYAPLFTYYSVCVRDAMSASFKQGVQVVRGVLQSLNIVSVHLFQENLRQFNFASWAAGPNNPLQCCSPELLCIEPHSRQGKGHGQLSIKKRIQKCWYFFFHRIR